MENRPLTPEDDNDDSDLSGKKKKKAENLAAFLVEPKQEEEKESKPESLWDQLAKKAEADEPTAEVDEAEAPLEELSPAEVEYIERQIIEAELQAEAGTEEEDPAEDAVQNFRHKVVEEEKTADEAFEETIDEVEAEPESEAEVDEAPESPYEITEPEGEIPLTREADETEPDSAATVISGVPPVTPTSSMSYGAVPPPVPGATLASPGATTTKEVIVESNPLPDMLIGGIIGYLIGRRHGRIKTEKRLLPIQKKLEKQVESLRQDISAKEEKIRQTVRKQRQAQEAYGQARSKMEVHPHAGKLPPEKIGHVLIAAESLPADKTEKNLPKPEKASVEKRVETLNRRDLLEMSEKVVIEATTLRQLYETNLIGEKGLRRLLVEHLRGGDVRRQLRRELVERQIDYERDPILRDRTPLSDGPNAGSLALKQMFKQVDKLSSAEAKEELAIYKAKEAYQTAKEVKVKQRRRRVDTALAATITILAVAVILLFLTRH